MTVVKNYQATKRIAGRMTANAYELLANRHRPTNPALIAGEVKRLHNDEHLTALDIATAMRINHAQVIQILSSSQKVTNHDK